MVNPPKQHDNQRMHEGRKPGLDARPLRHEEPLRPDDNAERKTVEPGRAASLDRARAQEKQASALGGNVAARSGAARTRREDRDDAEERSR